jgi:hypothetical protein
MPFGRWSLPARVPRAFHPPRPCSLGCSSRLVTALRHRMGGVQRNAPGQFAGVPVSQGVGNSGREIKVVDQWLHHAELDETEQAQTGLAALSQRQLCNRATLLSACVEEGPRHLPGNNTPRARQRRPSCPDRFRTWPQIPSRGHGSPCKARPDLLGHWAPAQWLPGHPYPMAARCREWYLLMQPEIAAIWSAVRRQTAEINANQRKQKKQRCGRGAGPRPTGRRAAAPWR